MRMKKKFMLSNIIMLAVPILLIGIITVIFLAIFILAYPAYNINITMIDLLNPTILIQTIGGFIQNNPDSFRYILLWMALCLIIALGTITINTTLLSKSICAPIQELTKAVEDMTDGNFDIEIMRSTDADINKLCVAFDDMRVRIKEGQEHEKKHIEDRKMLLANLSHDLKTPITSIKGYIEGIKDGVADTPEKLTHYLDTIYTKANVIEDMVNNMSMFSHLETGKLRFDFEIGDLHKLLNQLAEEYRIDIQASNMTFESDIPDRPAVIKIDFQKMRRVFANLIDNAIKYKKDDSGHISIISEIHDDGVLVQVSDCGRGIRESDLNKVFEGFYRSDPSRNLNIKGSGLGLGIAKQIVENHGGKMWIRSSENEGTTIYVYLPLRSIE